MGRLGRAAVLHVLANAPFVLCRNLTEGSCGEPTLCDDLRGQSDVTNGVNRFRKRRDSCSLCRVCECVLVWKRGEGKKDGWVGRQVAEWQPPTRMWEILHADD